MHEYRISLLRVDVIHESVSSSLLELWLDSCSRLTGVPRERS